VNPVLLKQGSVVMNKNSKKLVCGVGDNDVKYSTVKGTPVYEAYRAWKNMLNRAYSGNFPAYCGTDVSDDWKLLSKFAAIYLLNCDDGYELDKDILVTGNKQYGPDTCRYVPNYVNMLLVDRAASRGSLPIGVSIKGNRYQSQCNQLQNNGKSKKVSFGTFDAPEKAHQAWQNGKITAIERVIKKYKTEPNPLPEIIDALNQRIQVLKDDIQAGAITIKL